MIFRASIIPIKGIRWKQLFFISAFLFQAFFIKAEIIITEVFTDGTFALTNTGNANVDVSDYWACNFPSYEQLGNLTIECGSLDMLPGDDLILSGFNSLDSDDSELGIYTTSAFGNSNSMISYVEWGSTGHFRSSVAVVAGLWTTGDSAPGFMADQSLQYDGAGNQASDWSVNNDPAICTTGPLTPLEEAQSIVALGALEAGRTIADFNGSNRNFPVEYSNFLPSVIDLNDLTDPALANATLPIYEGVGPSGEPTYFIVTEATTIALALEYGAIVSPKLKYGALPAAAAAAQRVEVEDGRIHFAGDVDFSPERIVEPGSPNPFPPAFVQPGGVGDAEYSSLVVLPSGEVINCQIIANASGVHDRINEINIEERWANFQLLDGWEGGDRFYYHLVTDASDPGPAAIELGVYAPRMANLPTFGDSGLNPETVLLGFSPNVNGLTIAMDGADELNRQGLGSTLVDNDLDPVNIFPFDPDNSIEDGNNYSPMWDAHLNMWTDEAINGPAGDQRRAITSFADLFDLIDQGLVTSFAGSPGIENNFVNGLRASHAVINCPVICHPFQGGNNQPLTALEEAQTIVELGAAEAGRTVADFNGSDRNFPVEYSNFLPSVIDLNDLTDPALANATLPIYEGVGPSGEPTYFIVTEATTIELALEYGAIVSPKLKYGALPAAAAAAQRVEVEDGRIYFAGDVDFSPERIVEPGSPNPFPPAFVQPGGVGDAEYSSLVVLPSGEVINCQIIANASGVHDRINEINIEERWANFQLLDGWEGGDRFYYHLVTDASDPGPAAIELGVYAPRMANLPTFGDSGLNPETVLLGFSPNVNGLTIAMDGADELNRQGLGSTLVDNDLDPVNIFPFDPDNSIEDGNNYSPMWDAHLNMWTDEAINGPAGDQRRAITSFADLFDLIDQGLVTSFAGSPGIENNFVNGLRASHAVINCPVICHPFQGGNNQPLTALEEAQTIVELGAAEAGRTVADFNGSDRNFPVEYSNFLPSVIDLNDLTDPALANATLPIYEGVGPSGEPTYFIVTEATTIELALEYGAIVSPKLKYGALPAAAAAAQRVEVEDGRIYFAGDVDFSPERIVEPGSPNPFPPAFVQPGGVGDAEYSSLVVLPSGEVINCQIIANASGVHDRINEINIEERWANFQLLDGWEGGDRFYYHLVTDASDPGPAAIELGVYAPRMANLPTFGDSGLNPETVLLGFSPNVNGLTIAMDGADELNRQGLGSTLVDNDLDPVNIFPFDPDNSIEDGNNYSPMWDAHLNMWTDEAINGPAGDQRRAITSFADLFDLIDQGLVTSFTGSPGIENNFVNGLRASHAVINCPVICHPFQGGNNQPLTALEEAQTIVELGAAEAGRTVEDFNGSDRSFPTEYSNFLPSVIDLNDLTDPALANATLPIYEGVGPSGEPTYFIITEATSIELALEYGAIVSPKLKYGALPNAEAAAQRVQVENGRIYFGGDVDFSPERIVEAGFPNPFPPAFVQPGAVGDAEYSSLVVLPSGEVINCQIIANASGVHDRINEINIEERWANFQLLDGWEGGDRFYYHLVTDASDPGPAAIELGVYAPRMANLPTFGDSGLNPETVLLGFSPNVNGLTIAFDDADEMNRQGLGSTIVDNDLDPVNIFPFDPDNSIEDGNNYSPMWDAHLNMWTDEAINGPDGDQRRAITSFADLFDLIDQGLVTSFTGSPGIENNFVNGLRASHAVINCPVICHPFQGNPPMAGTARLQIIHAAASQTVELTVNDEVIDPSFAYRTATPYFDVPAGQTITIELTPVGGVTPASQVESYQVQLDNDETYVAAIYGTFDASDNFPVEFALQGSATEGSGVREYIDLSFFDGTKDLSGLDVIEIGDIIFDDVSYGSFATDFITFQADDYEIDITPENDNQDVLGNYESSFGFWKRKSAVIFTIGSVSEGTFEPWVALNTGGTYPLPLSSSFGNQIQTRENNPTSQKLKVEVRPNPTQDNATFTFTIPEDGNVSLKIVDVFGRTVSQLATDEAVRTGTYTREWSAKSNELPTGNYFAILTLNDKAIATKVIIQK